MLGAILTRMTDLWESDSVAVENGLLAHGQSDSRKHSDTSVLCSYAAGDSHVQLIKPAFEFLNLSSGCVTEAAEPEGGSIF